MTPIALLLVVVYGLTALWQRYKPVPRGLHGPTPQTFDVPAGRVALHFDTTRFEGGRPVRESHIVERLLDRLARAERALLDVFLLDLHETGDHPERPDTRRLAEAVRRSAGEVLVIADPVNTEYGTAENPPFDWLRAAGARVVQVPVRRLRHNNALYAPLYELLAPLLPRRRMVADIVRGDGGGRVSPYAIATALAARGDHRKVLLTRAGGSCSAFVASANLSDSTAYYDNVAVEVEDDRVAAFLLSAERALAGMCGAQIDWDCSPPDPARERTPGDGARGAEHDSIRVTPLMGTHIGRAILRDLAATRPGDRVLVGMLFVSSRRCIGELVAASRRGVEVHLVMDRNQKSFGARPGGFPNRVVARELRIRAPRIDVRWHRTDVEYHTKLVCIASGERRILHAGSANLTRRSLLGTNLETNLRLEMNRTCAVARAADRYVDALLGESSTEPVPPGQHVPWHWRLAYRLGEPTGFINA